MFGLLKKVLSRGAPKTLSTHPRTARLVRARYDAAVTNDENRRHWANADALSANAANSPEVRLKLRTRARYEIACNSYARGIVNTLANDCIGTGPRLQMLTDDSKSNRQVERAFVEWSESVGLAEKLRTMRMAKAGDGEAFAILTTNPFQRSPVKLDVRLIEADQVASPTLSAFPLDEIDGIRFDSYGNPATYFVLREHPGAMRMSSGLEFDKMPADSVIHYFRPDRPGQARGIPEITAALPLFAQLRRYTLAVIAAAETAADLALVIQTDAPANGETDTLEPMDTIELEKRMATVMPGGWTLGQAKAEQPVTTYPQFKSEILNEIARCLDMPFNVAAGNSSGYNYASGRLDHQVYFKAISVEQSRIESTILDRIFLAWLAEAALIEGLLPQSLRRVNLRVAHQWFWDGQEHVDPVKEADAQETRLRNNTSTLARECARQGDDWEEVLEQRARERAKAKALGLPDAEPAKQRAPEPEDADA